MEGLVTSADTGSSDLIRISRASLVDFCHSDSDRNGRSHLICVTLVELMRKHMTNDRILVPVMEVLAFLFDAGVCVAAPRDSYTSTSTSSSATSGTAPVLTSWETLFFLVQKAHFKSNNVRKLEAAVKIYGGLALVWEGKELDVTKSPLGKLVSMLVHPFPRVRQCVVDVLWVVTAGSGREGLKGLKGVDWTRARKEDVEMVKREMKEGGGGGGGLVVGV
jgi:hypothetical protein